LVIVAMLRNNLASSTVVKEGTGEADYEQKRLIRSRLLDSQNAMPAVAAQR
jgi:hypothetical protein